MLCAVDVEATIEFILKAQARTEVRVDGIARLLQQGMRMLVKTDKALAELAHGQKELAQAQKELAQAQRATERTLKAFIDSMRLGRNGRNGR